MASQPPDTGRDRNQVRPLRSTVSSVRGKANRHRSTGVFGSHFVLDCGGSREQAARFQDLLQQPSHPYLNGRANAESAGLTTNRKSPLLSMATSLSILISDTSGCVIYRFSEDSRSPRYPVDLGKTSNSIIWCLRSWLLRASRIRSFHSNRINSPRDGLIERPARDRGVRAEPFMEHELVLITSADAQPAHLSRSEFVKATLLVRESGSGSRQVVETTLKKAGIPLKAFKKVVILDSTEAIKSAVEVGLGIAFVSRWATSKELQLGTLKFVPVYVRVTRHFSLVTRVGPEPQGLVGALRTF